MLQLERFDSEASQVQHLVERVSRLLLTCVADRETALLMVPGGRTPQFFLEGLSRQVLPWSQIGVTLTDERCVPMGNERRNERMIRAAIPQARVVSLLDQAGDSLVNRAPVADVVVVGMGEDGHVASLFPGSRALDEAVAGDAETVLRIADVPAGEERVSRTYAGLRGRRGTFLLVRGEAKYHLLTAPPVPPLPVHHLLSAPVDIYWAP